MSGTLEYRFFWNLLYPPFHLQWISFCSWKVLSLYLLKEWTETSTSFLKRLCRSPQDGVTAPEWPQGRLVSTSISLTHSLSHTILLDNFSNLSPQTSLPYFLPHLHSQLMTLLLSLREVKSPKETVCRLPPACISVHLLARVHVFSFPSWCGRTLPAPVWSQPF